MPNLILQPLVENALEHGQESVLEISARRDGEREEPERDRPDDHHGDHQGAHDDRQGDDHGGHGDD